ncbi:THAP domain-containing protein 2-like isoform X4 [Odontomachus brunneus]|uniref:THAP domain-containing protein 2-like isoform X4 n=1 Tax=Odontomachus brunneus TaxID=486640 RepID=UPI0013F1AA82|nr:THAP domain-containing protein 2-like isoform X4 [Odontomachus brunneus]
MPDCYAKYCKSRRTEKRKNKIQLEWERKNGTRLSFHRIPKDSKKRKKWLDTMELSNRDIPEIAYICSLHFKESDLDRTSLSSIRIRPGAVPFVYTDKIKQYQGYLNVNNDEPPVKQEKLIKTDLLGEIENSMEIEEICEHKEKCLLKVENPIEIQEICENAENR